MFCDLWERIEAQKKVDTILFEYFLRINDNNPKLFQVRVSFRIFSGKLIIIVSLDVVATLSLSLWKGIF